VLNEEGIHRLRRIETKLTALGYFLGLDATPGKVRATLVNEKPPIIELGGFDVTFGEVLAFLQRRGIMDIATVVHKGTLIGNVAMPKKELPDDSKNEAHATPKAD
jgi:hypothetical protein